MSQDYQCKVRLGVVLIHQEKILLARQNGADFWVLPGGTLEPGEGLFECAVRELSEEAALDIVVERLLYLSDFVRPPLVMETSQAIAQPVRHTVDLVVLGRYLGGQLAMATDENLDELAFFTYAQFLDMSVKPASIAARLVEDWPAHFLGVSGVYLGKAG